MARLVAEFLRTRDIVQVKHRAGTAVNLLHAEVILNFELLILVTSIKVRVNETIIKAKSGLLESNGCGEDVKRI